MPDAPSSEAQPTSEIERLTAELERTRAALADCERRLFELRERRSAEMARLERQAYWLERAQIDLDAWMRVPAVRAVLRAIRAVVRLLRRLRPSNSGRPPSGGRS